MISAGIVLSAAQGKPLLLTVCKFTVT